MVVASELGVACGIAFDPDGTLFVGDRSGLDPARDGRAERRPSPRCPPSVAAFHLAFGPDGWLFVTAPTLGTHDCVYRISPDGAVEVFYDGFGRPQGLAFDETGRLYVVDALAGRGGVYRFDSADRPRRTGRGSRPANRSSWSPPAGWSASRSAPTARSRSHRPTPRTGWTPASAGGVTASIADHVVLMNQLFQRKPISELLAGERHSR